jgi:hypothetical protein
VTPDLDLDSRREQLIKDQLEAEWAHDLEAWKATWGNRPFCYDYPVLGRTLTPEQTLNLIKKNFDFVVQRETEFRRFHHCRDAVVVETRLRLRLNQDQGGTSTVTQTTTTTVSIYRFDGDELWQKSIYGDSSIARALEGL